MSETLFRWAETVAEESIDFREHKRAIRELIQEAKGIRAAFEKFVEDVNSAEWKLNDAVDDFWQSRRVAVRFLEGPTASDGK